jgi:lipopolysaccharide transport system ATP-binding protein
LAVAIQFDRVSKKYDLDLARPRSFQEMFVRPRLSTDQQIFWALRDVTFDIQAGESVALIGSNGAGKSTILKLVSRVIEPTRGSVKTYGRVAGLLELGTGFHPDLTGRENVFLNASILNIPRREIARQLDEIVDFADIGPFIDVQVRNYSSGMVVRLGFAVTTALRPDVLLIDEVLAVGDQNFQRKCIDRLGTLLSNGVTLVLVSHTLSLIRQLCKRAIWLDDSRIRSDGDAEWVTLAYSEQTGQRSLSIHLPPMIGGQAAGATSLSSSGARWGSGEVQIQSVMLLDEAGNPTTSFQTGDPVRVRMFYKTWGRVDQPAFGIGIHTTEGVEIIAPNSVRDGEAIPFVEGEGAVDYLLDYLPLNPGEYDLTVAVYDHDVRHPFDHIHRAYRFQVKRSFSSGDGLLVFPNEHWLHRPGDSVSAEDKVKSLPQ